MKVGVLKEIKNNENRVALTPKGVKAFVEKNHEVFVQTDAGIGSGLSNEDYEKAGAVLESSPKKIADECELVLKIKEPLKEEYGFFHEDQILFTYFHFAASRELTDVMMESQATCIAYETVELPDGRLPLLEPMSEVAGRMASLMGAYYLAKFNSGRGILMSGVTNVKPAKTLILGGGIVGMNAALIAAGLQSNVTILELSDERIAFLKTVLPSKVSYEKSTHENLLRHLPETDVLVGAVLVKGAKAPKLVSKEDVALMMPGSVIVDVAVDQGGSIETIHPTTHENPVYKVHDVIHYAVANMPGAFPRTSTFALTQCTLPYALELADKGLSDAIKSNEALRKGVNVHKGKVTYKGVSDAFEMGLSDAMELL